MRQLLIIAVLLFTASLHSQSLTDVFKQYIQPQSSTEDLRTGLKQIEKLCTTNPEAKCNKAKASALYLLADHYFEAAYQVYQVDQTLVDPILAKANALFAQANSFMPIENFDPSQKNMLLESKQKYETGLKYAVN
ncbi:hypothetical protein BN863_28760 [Formosa agariphila KMM 3901]|uniref:Uncharacterized protein n=1 Tax=Formosa agariphila (strain DSM 15362 / KCTC 12365 / LMG 23005 / KMM 3901 / M-2Alg 35-1) TaxID=1347342 RepID=T2KQ05_FORAG|nr:hypothetical protein [Formosa agariphila]CDF80588.1 hypothetical protein BN863_28760 [Formosa agariphila KMM 3901]